MESECFGDDRGGCLQGEPERDTEIAQAFAEADVAQRLAPIHLQVSPLATLHTRRSMRWDSYTSDVPAATVAEMDFPVAAPITAALHAAIDRHDLGYAQAHIPRLAEALSGFAARRMRWRVDPEQVGLLPDVMVGVLELARLLAGDN